MIKSKSLELSAAISCIAFLLAAGCSDNNNGAQSKRHEDDPVLPSIVDDKPSLANVDTSIEPHRLPQVEVATAAEQEPAANEPEQVAMPEDFAGLVAFAKKQSSGDSARALEALELARKLKPNSAMPDIESARVLLATGKTEDARQFAEAALEIDPSSSYGWNTMGRVELSEGDFEAALASFERATEENEDNSYAWNNLGLTLMRLDRYPEAATALERATSGGRPSAFMFNNLGMTYEHLARFDLAAAAYRQAKDLGSSRAVANLQRLEDDGIDLSPPVTVDGDPVEGIDDSE